MVSAQTAGTVNLYIRSPDGSRRLQASGAVAMLGPSGSSNGTIASTPEKWTYLAPCADVGASNYMLEVEFTPGANVTIDISDAAWQIPVIVNGVQQYVGNPDNASGIGNPNFFKDFLIGDVALIAASPTLLAQLRLKAGTFQIGGNKIFMSVEDNA